jgi:PIN domain
VSENGRENDFKWLQASSAVMMRSNIGVGCQWAASLSVGASQLYQSLPESVFLRASDCLHLVTALNQGFEEICTFDRHQQAAVRALGLAIATIWPKIFKLAHQAQEPWAQQDSDR